ncbi:hypothetical protein LPB72_17655 [Hydrogenophaga crassostreae]|uniref:DUF3047 domain-containing protein n=1 Tax=Hydrogenophaga crassostreae TaxID=1763535 RepID=A0A167GXU3_9BURK|nr:DUF3047 domain-containing protein [Hydrogenophaga crassostreae]AOW12820.1 hypothetical protein LPB072_08160 [Hydrogenophaga crassostreae]OAD40007.1 hypothetical protein LPB72_17655 [Hydrogenophaga crassostreae]
MHTSAMLARLARASSSAVLALWLAACASTPPSADGKPDELTREDPQPALRPMAIDGTAWQTSNHIEGAGPAAQWQHQLFVKRRPTLYQAMEYEGRPAIKALAEGSNSTLSLALNPQPGELAQRFRFSWFVPALNTGFDLSKKGTDDAVARLVLSFSGDRFNGKWAARDHLVSELSSLIAGKPLPYASIMYVWDSRYPAGSVIPNPYTDRIRQIVVESGPQRLNQWVDFERDVEADFRMAFGEEPGAMVGLSLMTDSNNSGASVTAWYGPIDLTLSTPSH